MTAPTEHPSVLSPPASTRHALVETRHRLIRTPDLNLEKRGHAAVAASPWALHVRLVGVVPCARTAKDILSLLACVRPPRVHGLGDVVLIGARTALEPVPACLWRGRHGEDVGAMGADCEREDG